MRQRIRPGNVMLVLPWLALSRKYCHSLTLVSIKTTALLAVLKSAVVDYLAGITSQKHDF